MTIEASQYINQLNVSYPRATDLLKEGDDHIRMIKSNLINTFSNFTGPVTVSSDFLNNLNINLLTSPAGITFNKGFNIASGQTIDFNFSRLNNVPTPTNPQDVATKSYVDARAQTPAGNGMDGRSALQIAIDTGKVPSTTTEAQFVDFLKGPKGDPGIQGPAGAVPTNTVLTSGTQTIAGVKTFSDTPIVTGLTVKDTTGTGIKTLTYTDTGKVLEIGEDTTNVHFLGHSFDFGNQILSKVKDPVAAQDVATKNYVDGFKIANQTNATTFSDPPTKAEADAFVAKYNALLAALQASGLMAAP